MKGIALSKLLVELKSPQHAIKVQILSSSMKMSFLLLPLNKFYQFQLLLCLCCEKIVFFGWFWRWESKMGSRKCWKKSEPKLSSTTSFCKVRSLPLLGSNGWYVLNIHWIGTKTDSIQYSFKTEARIQNKYSFFFKNLEYSFKINIHF